MHRSLVIPAVSAALALLPPVAGAVPFTAGDAGSLGGQPALSVDPTTGDAVLAYRTSDDAAIATCTIARGAGACAGAQTLLLPGGGHPERPFVTRDPVTGHLLVTTERFAASDTWGWESADGGHTWGAARKLASVAPGERSARPLARNGRSLIMGSSNPGAVVHAVSEDATTAAGTTAAALPDGGVVGLDQDFGVAPAPDGGLLAVADDLTTTYAWHVPAGASPDVAANWAGPVAVADGADAALAGDGDGAVLATGVPGRIEARRTTPDGFGPAAAIENQTAYMTAAAMAPSGTSAIAYRVNDPVKQLRVAIAQPLGAFSVRTIADDDVVYQDLSVAVADDGRGFAAWTAEGQVRVASTDALPETISATKAVPGGKVVLSGSLSCVTAGGKLRVRAGFAGRGRLRRVVFRLGTVASGVDRRSPFAHTFRVPSRSAPRCACAPG